MTDEISYSKQPDSREQRRQAVEDVFLAFRPDAAEHFARYLGRPVPAPDQALLRLSDADVPRVLKQRMLIDAMRRWSRDMDIMAEPIDRVLMSTIDNDSPTLLHRLTKAKRHWQPSWPHRANGASSRGTGEVGCRDRSTSRVQHAGGDLPGLRRRADHDQTHTRRFARPVPPDRVPVLEHDPPSDFIDYVNIGGRRL